jgi:hypothetical protein
MFFGVAIGIILFVFVARIVFFAFIIAAFMSIVYAIYRRLKYFITYDRNGEYYMKAYKETPRMNNDWNNEVEPLFHGSNLNRRTSANNIRFINAI